SKRPRRLLVARWQSKTVCATCTALTTCREIAMKTNELHRKRGGLTEIHIHNLAGTHHTGRPRPALAYGPPHCARLCGRSPQRCRTGHSCPPPSDPLPGDGGRHELVHDVGGECW